MQARNFFPQASFLFLFLVALLAFACKPTCEPACQNGAECTDTGCLCPIGYEGETCAILSRDKFIGGFRAYDLCDGDTIVEYDFSFQAGPADTEILMIGLAGVPGQVTGTMRGPTKFTFEAQTIDNGALTVFGDGFIQVDTRILNVVYTKDDGTGPINCRADSDPL